MPIGKQILNTEPYRTMMEELHAIKSEIKEIRENRYEFILGTIPDYIAAKLLGCIDVNDFIDNYIECNPQIIKGIPKKSNRTTRNVYKVPLSEIIRYQKENLTPSIQGKIEYIDNTETFARNLVEKYHDN